MQKIFEKHIIKTLTENQKKLKKDWHHTNDLKTRHLIIDNLLPTRHCKNIYNTIFKSKNKFLKFNSLREKKKTTGLINKLDPILYSIFKALQSRAVIRKISKIISLKNLDSDPSSYAGGLSIMSKGDFLNPHIDNSHDRDLKKYRRLNLLYYVTPNWKNNYGGNFELWDEGVKKRKLITSKFNRLVIMETNKQSWHSVNKVLTNKNRCCVSNYYFSSTPPEKEEYFHVTSFTGRPNEKIKRIYGIFDNLIRNFVSNTTSFGRNKKFFKK